MSAQNYDDLREHVGHAITCVGYGEHGDASAPDRTHFDNVAVECEDCGCVLLDFDRAPAESGPANAYVVLAGTFPMVFLTREDAERYARLSGNEPIHTCALRTSEDVDEYEDETPVACCSKFARTGMIHNFDCPEVTGA